MLLTNMQTAANLRRTASKGLISLLNQYQLEQLALKYFGVYQKGQLIGYQCPYSGEVITDFSDIVLEHIIPINSNGGTILFNCIPTSTAVNKVNEKGSQHLLNWWHTSDKYKHSFSPERLMKLLDYIFEAYEIVFESHSIDDLEVSYVNSKTIQHSHSIEMLADLSTTSKEEQIILKEQAKRLGRISYFSFLNDCINDLVSYNIDVSKYKQKINELESKGIFKNISKYSTAQNILKKIIKTRLNTDDKSELTIVSNIDIIKMLNSMVNCDTEEEITNEILKRIDNIENILNEYNVDIISFFQNIKNVSYILFKPTNEISQEEIVSLVNDIRVSVDSRFKKLINEVSQKNKIDLSSRNFLTQIKSIELRPKKRARFCITLNKSQLELLAKSSVPLLKSTYLEILMKSYRYGIYDLEKIIFTQENQMLYNEINAYYSELKLYNVNEIGDLDLKTQKKFYEKYNNILSEPSLIKLINWLERNPDNIPSRGRTFTEEENKMGKILNRLIICHEHKFDISLSKQELEYIATSKNQVLQWIYYERYKKAKKYNIEFDCEIIPLKVKRPIKRHMIFEDMIEWFNKNPGDKIPSTSSKDEKEKIIGRFYQDIKTISSKYKTSFNKSLSKKELETIATSTDERLLKLYAEIYNKAKENCIYLSVDIPPKIVPSKSNNLFNELLNWISNNPGEIPSVKSDDEHVKRIATTYQSIKTLEGHGKKQFQMNLSKEELYILATSKDDVLKRLYKEILLKSIKKNIYDEKEIIYTEENVTLSKIYKDYFAEIRANGAMELRELCVEKQIEIIKKYPNIEELEKTMFIRLIEWLAINKGTPKKETSKAKSAEETKIGSFWWRLSNVIYNKQPTFKTMLAKEELFYMFNSKDTRLKDMYSRILKKAIKNEIVINYYPTNILGEIMVTNQSYYNKIKETIGVNIDFEYSKDKQRR